MITTFIPHGLGTRIAALAGVCVLASATAACTIPDADIRSNVETQVAVDPATNASNITVTVTKGVVRIEGETATREAQSRIVEITRAIKGVKDVTTDLHLSDAGIVARVEKTLAADPTIGKIGIAVESEDGLVRLRSNQTNKDERTRAVELTKAVDGVKTVEDWMR